MSWLGWDQHPDLHADGSTTGPYQPWQVLGLVVTLFLVTRAGAARRASVITCTVLALTMTACFGVDAGTNAHADGLWVVGAALVLVGSALGAAIVATLYRQARGRRAVAGR